MRLRTLLVLASLTIVLGLIGVAQAGAAIQDQTDSTSPKKGDQDQTNSTSPKKGDKSANKPDQNNGTPIEQTDPTAAGAQGAKPDASTLPKSTVIFGVVDSKGTLARGTGAVSAKKLSTGQYEVIFDRNVRNCGYAATIGLSGASGGSPPGQITTAGRQNNVNGVFVATFDASGALSDRGFHLQAAC